ncbi:acyl-CoA synthetase [soil metagenome]
MEHSLDPHRPPRLPRIESRRQFDWRIPDRFNIATATVDRVARRTPGAIALLEPQRGRAVTFAAMKEASDRLANVFRASGVGPGDRVGVLLRQSYECALVHLATYKAGAIAVPLSVLFGEDALRYRLEDAGVRLLIAERGTIERLAEAIPASVSVRDAAGLEADMLAASATFEAHPTAAGDPAILLYTSGTTGRPKGALLPHRTLLGHLSGFVLYSNFPTRAARYWSPADWAWIGGLLDVLFPAWYCGCTVLAFREDHFDPEGAVRLLEQQEVTHTFLFPTALKLLRGLGRLARPLRLESVHSGGEPLGMELQEWSREQLGVSVNEFYGQTEANLLVGNGCTVDPIRPGSMGLPYPGHEVVLLDDDGAPLAPGTIGEIAVRTPDPVAFLGYWQNPEATAEKFHGPFLRTGDLATMDDDGYLWFTSRKDDLIKAAGYRISPFEVEEALMRHPEVAMSAVIGVADAARGQKVLAFVTLHAGRGGTPELERSLQDLVRRSLGHHAYPREVRFVAALPLTTSGKIQRFRLREMVG